jgi:hypothetical protein
MQRDDLSRVLGKEDTVSRWTTRLAVVAGSVGVFMTATSAGALADTRAWWRMDDTGTTMSDASQYGNTGQLTNVDVGIQPPVFSGRSYRFDATDTLNSYVTVPDNNSLDPGNATITITAWINLTGPILDDSYDIVRKGLGNTAGGDWKMEIKNIKNLGAVGKLKCSFRGDPGSVVTKTARPDIMDGQPHELKCIKTANSVVAMVDGRAYTKSGSAGSIANSSNTMLGSKVPGDDQYNGLLDEVKVEIG